MRLAGDRVHVRVPATSANLGPGFDALGLALGCYDEVEVRVVDGDGTAVEVTGEGSGTVPTGPDHLVVRAVRTALEAAGAPVVGLHLTCTNAIPHGRGMGSSAAAVVAGIVAARALLEDPGALDDDEALRIATVFEGHPDNAAPALLGGATVAWTGPHGPQAVGLPVHPDVVPVVLVPQAQCSTRAARGVLPSTVPHVDAALTAGRSALLVHALAHRPDLLWDATVDRLHQDYRAEVMPVTWRLVQALRAVGQAAVVSGAGPAVLVLDRADGAPDAAAVRRDVLADVVGSAGPQDASGWAELTPGVSGQGAVATRG